MTESLVKIMIAASHKDSNITEIHAFNIPSSRATIPLKISINSHVYNSTMKVSLSSRGRNTGHFLYKED